jgi:predicted transglutaminase-like cysteine proteinase
MSVFYWPRCGSFLLALAFVFTATNSAPARQNVKKAKPRPAHSLGLHIPNANPARYFTINEVLAKREAQRAPASSLQFASTTTTTMTDAPRPGRHSLPSSEPFGLSTFRAPEGLLWFKWRGIEQQLQVEAKVIELCRADANACPVEAQRFLAFVESAQARDGRARIEVVNRAINSAIRYTSDYAQHGVADLWTAPLATLAAGRGDCEDYAIAKYVMLRAAGIPAHDLRLLLVRDRLVRQDHAVLAVRDNGRWLILDNRHLLLVETSGVQHFTPLFAIDRNGVSLFAAPYVVRPTPAIEPATVLSPANERAPAEHASIQSEPQASWGAGTTPYLL